MVFLLSIAPIQAQSPSADEAVPGEILVRYTDIGAKTAADMVAGNPAPARSAFDFWQSFTSWLGLGSTSPEMEARIARDTLEELAAQFAVTDQKSLGRNPVGTRTIKLGAQQVFTNPSNQTGTDPFENVYKITFQNGTIGEFITEIMQSGLAVEAQPNLRYQAEVAPNDGDYPSQWYHQRIGSEQAWNTTTGSQQIIVAVLDTGVMYSHPELINNMWQGDVGGGQTGYGYDFVSGDADPNDENGHGTHVAGIIGAKGNNGIGVAGVNWDTRIMGVRVLRPDGTGTTETVGLGMRFAVDHGARILNISLGQIGSCTVPDTMLATVISDATSKRALLVVAAGNTHINAACDSPANHPDVLVVGARGPQDEAAPYSNYGLLAWKNVKIVTAPGGVALSGNVCDMTTCILSTRQGGGYASAKGTSFAAPVVSGLAALILSVRDMDPATLRAHIITTAIDKNDDFTTPNPNPDIPNDDGKRTYGKMVNAAAAISQLTALAVSATPGPSDSRIPVGTTDTLTINIIGTITPSPTTPAGVTVTLTPSPTLPQPTVTPGGPTVTIRPTVTPGGPTQPAGGDDDDDNDGIKNGDDDDGDDDNDGINDADDDDGDGDGEKDVDVKFISEKNGKTSEVEDGASVVPGTLMAICYNRKSGNFLLNLDTGKGVPVQFNSTFPESAVKRCLHSQGNQFIPVGDVGDMLASRIIRVTLNNRGRTVTKWIKVIK